MTVGAANVVTNGYIIYSNRENYADANSLIKVLETELTLNFKPSAKLGFIPGATYLRHNIVTGIKCGTYKCLDTYGNKAGFVQQKMTIPGFYISAETHEVIPFIDWKQGLDLLR